MKTIEIKIYSFSELSEKAKQRAIEDYRNSSQNDHYFIYQEAHETVKEFHNLFKTEEGRNSWLNIRTEHINDDVLNLSGLRLRKYILNNFGNDLFKPQYKGSLKNKTPHRRVRIREFKNGKFSAHYYSAVFKTDCCVLTGVCYDEEILKPIYDFLKEGYKGGDTFEDLLNDCMHSLKKSIEAEIEYRNSDECIEEEIEANELEFTEDGKRY